MDVRIGDNEVRVVGADETVGRGALTVTGAGIGVAPPEGRQGTQATVSGTGFAAHGFFLLSYGDGGDLDDGGQYLGAGQADGTGRFEVPIKIPLEAAIGRRHKVTAEKEFATGNGTITLRAEADHSPPAAVISVSSPILSPGDVATVSGENLTAFVLVRPMSIGGRDVTPFPNVNTDRDGAFEATFTVPFLEYGDQSLRVEVLGVIVTKVIEVAAPTRKRPPSEVFKDLVDAGVLLRVWYLYAPTQSWSFFDPSPELVDLSNLTAVKATDIVWLHLTAPYRFQGDDLVAGWNFIALK